MSGQVIEELLRRVNALEKTQSETLAQKMQEIGTHINVLTSNIIKTVQNLGEEIRKLKKSSPASTPALVAAPPIDMKAIEEKIKASTTTAIAAVNESVKTAPLEKRLAALEKKISSLEEGLKKQKSALDTIKSALE